MIQKTVFFQKKDLTVDSSKTTLYFVMNVTSIRKNDVVTNNNPVTSYGVVVPIGTQFRVYKAKRDGTILCSAIDRHISCSMITMRISDVTKIEVAKDAVNVGDIYVCSWGYEQTNVDYYKVMSVKNKTVTLAAIGENRNYTGSMIGTVTPNQNNISDTHITKRIQYTNNKPYFKMSNYSYAYPWNGKPNCFSEYH